MKFIRKNISKPLSVFMMVCLLNTLFAPTLTFALTGGPSQPETQGFQPVGTSDMVDLFSGDFSYNIPLMDVGGYPINMSYSSAVNSDMEASWVGLGWTLSPGSVNRTVRGIPDDFKGDKIHRDYHRKEQFNVSTGIGVAPEVVGIDVLKIAEKVGLGLKFTVGVDYNSYTGVGASVGVQPTLSVGAAGASKLNVSVGLSASSSQGVGISPNVSYSSKTAKDDQGGLDSYSGSVGVSFNSRQGLGSITTGSRMTVGNSSNSGSASFNAFSMPTHTHNTSMPTFKFGASFEGAFGPEVFGVDVEVDFDAAVAVQKTANERDQNAYGYFYEEEGGKFDLLDFNREKDGPVNKHRPFLPITSHTHDIYSISGQGVGGSYRAYRHDVGIVYDPMNRPLQDVGVDVGFAIELGVGNVAKYGGSGTTNVTKSIIGPWTFGNQTKNVLGFRGSQGLGKEVFYLDQPGDKKVDTDVRRFERLGGEDAVRIEISNEFISAIATKNIGKGTSVHSKLNRDEVLRDERAIRNQPVSFLTAKEASKVGHAIVNRISIKNQNDFDFDLEDQSYDSENHKLTRLSSNKKTHHVSEIKVTREDGARYIYGIPAYNWEKREITFSVGPGHTPECMSGLVSYDNDDLTIGNRNGNDHLYDNTETPAYAHSHLLTAVLSSDYVDLSGDGPTPDDLGSYTKLNYSVNKNYKWRTPYIDARYDGGALAVNQSFGGANDNKSDDKASIVYGRKEMYYVHSIETKTHLAEFTLSNRLDGLGVSGINNQKEYESLGTLINEGSKKIDRIDLYTIEEKLNEARGETAVPIKSVHFEYDYSLCPGIDNSATKFVGYSSNSGLESALKSTDVTVASLAKGENSGKLTLKKVYFTYEDSFKGKLNKYKFQYSDSNPGYNLKANDRWGNYKAPSGGATSCYEFAHSEPGAEEFPYTKQEDITNDYAKSWLLDKIDLPSGGRIEVDYEADSYAYVQDKKAMQMFHVIGAGNSSVLGENNPGLLTNSTLYGSDNKGNDYFYFKLSEKITGKSRSAANKIVKNLYNKEIDEMFFKFFVEITNGLYEYISGYTKLSELDGDNIGVVQLGSSTDYEYGYVRVEMKGIRFNEKGDNEVNPVSKAAWQFTRRTNSELIYDAQRPPGNDNKIDQAFMDAVGGVLKSIISTAQGINRYLRNEGYAKNFKPNRSFIRLHEPTGHKLGGGCRVKSVKLFDNWDIMSGGETAEAYYGQEYDYTKEEGGVTISSGVAAYEPVLGGEENPFRTPIDIGKENNFLVPGLGEYLETPMGESFFPGASVGYSKVTVRNVDKTHLGEAEIRRTGKTVHEFYTARDFPTKTDQTEIDIIESIPELPFNPFKIFSNDFYAASQGYVVELNNMHGKQKSQRIHAQGDEGILSGVDYNYVLEGREISNKVDVLDEKGNMSKANIGLDYDLIADMRSSADASVNTKFDIDLDAFLIGIIPVPIPSFQANFVASSSKYQSAGLMKVVNRSGILKETVAYDLGAMISTENLVWDSQTGNVLLTKTKNAFDDEVYSFNYPAHWADDRMGFAYKNLGLRVNSRDYNLDGFLNLDRFSDILVEGDELGLTHATVDDDDFRKVWVTNISAGGKVTLRNRDGGPNLSNYAIREFVILRSGRRNMQSASVGAVTMLTNPIVNGQMNFEFENVLDASATIYKDLWKVYCSCGIDPNDTDNYNAFAQGERGNYKAFKSFLFLTERTQQWENNNTNIRKDGVFSNFESFWNLPTSGTGMWFYDDDETNSKWQFTTEITECSPYGFELENQDALERYSGAIYGYRNTLPTAVANNAEYSDIAFDNFEDYYDRVCDEKRTDRSDHFSFKEGYFDEVVREEAHSGKYSIKVGSGKEFTVRRDLIECGSNANSGTDQN